MIFKKKSWLVCVCGEIETGLERERERLGTWTVALTAKRVLESGPGRVTALRTFSFMRDP